MKLSRRRKSVRHGGRRRRKRLRQYGGRLAPPAEVGAGPLPLDEQEGRVTTNTAVITTTMMMKVKMAIVMRAVKTGCCQGWLQTEQRRWTKSKGHVGRVNGLLPHAHVLGIPPPPPPSHRQQPGLRRTAATAADVARDRQHAARVRQLRRHRTANTIIRTAALTGWRPRSLHRGPPRLSPLKLEMAAIPLASDLVVPPLLPQLLPPPGSCLENEMIQILVMVWGPQKTSPRSRIHLPTPLLCNKVLLQPLRVDPGLTGLAKGILPLPLPPPLPRLRLLLSSLQGQ